MTREEKAVAIQNIKDILNDNSIVYLADIEGLDATVTSSLRRACHGKGVKLQVVKNTFLKKAMESSDKNFEEMYDLLKGNTSILTAEVANEPAKIIKEFRKKSEKPILKGAFIEEAVYVGDDQIDALSTIKSKEELIGEVIGLLQSPVKNVISALKSSSSTIAGIVKTLQEKEQ